MNQITTTFTVQFNGKTYPVDSIPQAQALWGKVRDEAINAGMGSSDCDFNPIILVNGIKAGHISWNGRAWKNDGKEWL